MTPLPAPNGRPYRVAMVCLGNICRSPMADVIMSDLVESHGLTDSIEVTSSGTGDWHLGHPMDSRAAAQLSSMDHDPSSHRAKQFTADWADRDLILAMDHSNLANINNILGDLARPGQVRLFREFDPQAEPDAEVPDPYYGGDAGFVDVATMVERTCVNLLGLLTDHLR
jgi:protein-tyrosine phosphatase